MKTSFSASRLFSLVLLLTLSTGSASFAETIIGYNFNGLTGPYGGGSETYVAPNANDGSDYNTGTATGSNLTRGSNYNTNVQGNGYFTQNGFGIQPTNNVFPTTVSASDSNGSYIQFQVHAVGGRLSLSTLNFGGGNQNGGILLGLSYSTNGTTFSTAGIPGGDNGIPVADYTGGNGGFSTPYLASVDLSSIAALQDFNGTITFDLSLLGGGGYTTGDFTRNYNGTASTLDDISLDGRFKMAPEPSTWAMLFVGMGSLLLCHKLRRQRRA